MNPLPKLEVSEGKTVEFKRSIFYSPRTSQPDSKQLDTIVKEIAAFINTEGGDLYLGVTDAGCVVGVDNDLCLLGTVHIEGKYGTDKEYSYKSTKDGYAQKICNLIRMKLGDLAVTLISDLEWFKKGSVSYARLHVNALENDVVYLDPGNKLYVRVMSSSVLYKGDKDKYVRLYKQPIANTKKRNSEESDYETPLTDKIRKTIDVKQQSVLDSNIVQKKLKKRDVARTKTKLKSVKKKAYSGIAKGQVDEGKTLSSKSISPRRVFKNYPVTQVVVSSVRLKLLDAFIRCQFKGWASVDDVEDQFEKINGLTVLDFVGYDLDTLSRDPMGRSFFMWRIGEDSSLSLQIASNQGSLKKPLGVTVTRVGRYLKDKEPESVDFDRVGFELGLRAETVLAACALSINYK